MQQVPQKNPEDTRSNRRMIWLIIAAAAILLLGLLLFINRPNTTEQRGGASVTVNGYFACLPLKQQNQPGADNCVLGIRGDDGRHYAIDVSSIKERALDLTATDHLEVTGTLVSAGQIPAPQSEQLNRYDITGLLYVYSLKKY